MLSKNINRLRRARRTRCKIRELGVTRLSFHKSNQHLYAQLIQPQTMSDDGNSSDKTLATISTAGKAPAVKGKNRSAAEQLGNSIALKAKELGLNKIAFDRGGNKYHGRVKDFAEAARKSGLEF